MLNNSEVINLRPQSEIPMRQPASNIEHLNSNILRAQASWLYLSTSAKV